MKKIVAILGSFILLLLITGCSSKSLTEENLYLAGTYTAQWDATENYARAYYKLDKNKEFVKPDNSLMITTTLVLNKDGTYKITTADNQIPMLFDMFLTNNTIYQLEVENLYDGDSHAWVDSFNEKAESYDVIVQRMIDNAPMDAITISKNGKFSVKDDYIKMGSDKVTIESQGKVVKLTFEENNKITGNEVFFIKKG